MDEVVFQCDCHNHHYLTISWVDAGQDEPYRYLDFCTVNGKDRIRTRIANAFRCLIGQEVITACISLDLKKTQELYAVIGRFV